jgi:fluoride exporter
VKIVLVGIGGCIGSIARYAVGGFVQDLTQGTFPFGTLAVNVVGCLLIGGLSELADTRSYLSADARALLVVGLLGGFTTFSAFGNETVNLLRDREGMLALANVAAHLVLAVGSVWLGRAAAQLIWR